MVCELCLNNFLKTQNIPGIENKSQECKRKRHTRLKHCNDGEMVMAQIREAAVDTVEIVPIPDKF